MAWVQVFNYACIILLFWTNFIPGFGNVSIAYVSWELPYYSEKAHQPLITAPRTPFYLKKCLKGQSQRMLFSGLISKSPQHQPANVIYYNTFCTGTLMFPYLYMWHQYRLYSVFIFQSLNISALGLPPVSQSLAH